MQTLLSILQVALGLGFVIFVHELGHFAVAKWCGVRCDRFYVGFDVPFGRFLNWLMGKEGEFKLFGIGIPRTVGPTVQWGETQYGIGILPLGGYVKMFGQDDNVANLAEERERSKALEGSPDAKKITGPDGEDLWVDRRSYLAKTVP
ncbi:MAG: site-2 protease family protein, partial [Planctomycetota bacterium]